MSSSQDDSRPLGGADSAELATYFQKFSEAFTRVEEELARWNAYKDEYEALRTTLLDLPKKVSRPVMVPIGNLAFMPGSLIHTNEILVMLGDNWFVDRSATQAAEIVDRRMEFVEENISKIKEQEASMRDKSGLAPGLLGGQEYNEEGLPIVEIIEPYYSDDEEIPEVKAPPKVVSASSKSATPVTPVKKPVVAKGPQRVIVPSIPTLEKQATPSATAKSASNVPELVSASASVSKSESPVVSAPASSPAPTPASAPVPTSPAPALAVGPRIPSALPFSVKTPAEQAADQAILDRIAELEREDEERERRREAGEEVTSDEETESDDEPYLDDEDSEDEFRPKALDSDEEYEEAVLEYSEQEEDHGDEAPASGGAKGGKKSVRFSDQVRKAMQPSTTPALNKGKGVAGRSPTQQQPPAEPRPKAKSPADIYNQMRSRQQQARSSVNEPMVNMASLQSTFAGLMGGGGGADPSGLGPTPNFDTLSETKQQPVSILKPTPAPGKKLSKFAIARAAKAELETNPSSPVAAVTGLPVRKGGVAEQVFEKPMAAPVIPTAAPVVERSIVSSQGRDIIENTFTGPTRAKQGQAPTPAFKESVVPAAETEALLPTGTSTSGRRKPSLFRKQVQADHLAPDSAFQDPTLDDEQEYGVVELTPRSIPKVMATSSSKLKPPTVMAAAPPTIKASSTQSDVKKLRPLAVVASEKVSDTGILKGAVVERSETEPVDEEELEQDMLMRQVVSEYQEKRQAMIAKHGAFGKDEIEEIWHQQVVLPEEVSDALATEAEHLVTMLAKQKAEAEQVDGVEDGAAAGGTEAEAQMMRHSVNARQEDGADKDQEPEMDDRNQRPKKLSLFRAARLTGTLSK